MIDITLPAEQAEGTESVVASWFKQVGDPVALNEPLLEISTDKVTVEIAAPAAGVLREILKSEGDAVEPGDVVGRIEETTGARADATPPEAGATAHSGDTGPIPVAAIPELSPAVRRLLQEHGLDPTRIRGTGKGGRITVEDVEASLRAAGAPGRPGVGDGGGPSRRVPHTTMRKAIAEHLTRSMATAPHVTSVFEADLSAVMAHRQANQAEVLERGVRLTYTAYFVRAAVAAIGAVPQSNARWHDDALEIWEEMNIGIATALETGGLIVPVIRRAQELDLFETARTVHDLTERARGGRLEPRDVQQGTFTISNHGVSGSLVAAPVVINQPQSAILGVGKLQQRPVVVNGAIEARPMVYVTLTIDHRVLDGYDANRWLAKFVEAVEEWGIKSP
jgi:2-oxoglutarate dehydrogenase E2 component (dihydrolipoamide succinyltransferase)